MISATDTGREGVWSSQTPISRNWLRQNFGIWLPLEIRFKAEDFVFSIVFSIGGFDVANRLAIPRAKRFAIPHSTLCPVASFGTTNRDRKFLGALFCSGALWEHCVRRFIPDLNVDYREPRLAEQFSIFETFLPLTKYLFRPSSYTCSFGLHLAYVHGSLSNRERPLRFSNDWGNLNEQHHESVSWNFHRASEIWYSSTKKNAIRLLVPLEWLYTPCGASTHRLLLRTELAVSQATNYWWDASLRCLLSPPFHCLLTTSKSSAQTTTRRTLVSSNPRNCLP